MYNYYSSLKKNEEQRSKEKMRTTQKRFNEKRKKELEHFVDNYENRVKGFIYKMAASPIKITDYHNKISSSRKEFLDEENGKILGSRGFVFTNYKTERERIEEYLKDKNTINMKHSVHQLRMDDDYKTRQKNSIQGDQVADFVQPSMRFKARTDFERIVDSVKYHSYGRLETADLLNAQRRNRSFETDDTSEAAPDYAAYAVRNLQKQYQLEKQKEKKKKFEDDKMKKKKLTKRNHEAYNSRQLMSDLHLKTHFKGASGFMLFKNTSTVDSRVQTEASINRSHKSRMYATVNSHHNATTKPSVDNENYLTTNSNYYASTNPNTNLSTDAPFTTRNTFYRTEKNIFNNNAFHDPEISEEIIQSNPLLYNLNINPYKKRSDWDLVNIDQHKLQYLKELAFAEPKKEERTGNIKMKNSLIKRFTVKFANTTDIPNNTEKGTCENSLDNSMVIKNKPNFFKKLCAGQDNAEYENSKKLDEEKINVDGEFFYKSDVDKIAKKVLTGCNYVHLKNKNNFTTHKTGEGKMMITCGMTVNDFMNKYGLNPTK